ncbi:L-threonine ammonia-lyase-like [Clavelina lepadiformis]|uniref:L-serine ammonia-lyase n=1 Tax=Clavelina lepadiformis TaxID=159417 RepID=A0ABP0H525_CLALP
MDSFPHGDDIEEILDPFCDPDRPVVVKFERIADAYQKINKDVVRTPCTRSKLSEPLGVDLYFKKEFMQFTGSFKDRGALYSLLNLTNEQQAKGVVTTSAGNHAQALSHQGRRLGVPVTVVMPKQAPLIKVTNCRDLKANVILHGNRFDEAKLFGMAYGKHQDLLYINGYDHPDIIAGQGTAGIEILEDVPDVDYVIVPIGGGGLIAGISAAVKHLKPSVTIIGVESDKCPSWTTAMKYGRPLPCEVSRAGAADTIADGLAVMEVGCNAFATANPLIDKVVRVSEDYIGVAILKMLETEKAVVEGAGAAGLAAIISGQLPELQGKRVACLLCGGNIDPNVLVRVVDRAMMMDGRLNRFSCVISDRSGGLVKLLAILATSGASVRDISHDRMSLPAAVFKTCVTCKVETRDGKHADELREKLFQIYGEDLFWET